MHALYRRRRVANIGELDLKGLDFILSFGERRIEKSGFCVSGSKISVLGRYLLGKKL